MFSQLAWLSLSLALFVFAALLLPACCRTLAGLFRKLSVRLFFSPRAACSDFLNHRQVPAKDSKERQEREALLREKILAGVRRRHKQLPPPSPHTV